MLSPFVRAVYHPLNGQALARAAYLARKLIVSWASSDCIAGVVGRVVRYWALLIPSWDLSFRYREYLGRRYSLETAFEKKAGKLERISAPHKQGCEVSLNSD